MKVDDSSSLSLGTVMNIPNPMRMGQSTRFFYYSNQTTTQNSNPATTSDVTIKIYSLSGRVLKVIRNAQNGEAWDGRDQTGYVLPPDVYLYQVAAAYRNIVLSSGLSGSSNVKSAIQKLVIYPPR
jgi:flagellar hook assembly protein FlgD